MKSILQTTSSTQLEQECFLNVGQVYELQKDIVSAKEAYERGLSVDPSNTKLLQHLAFVHIYPSSAQSFEAAITHLLKAIEIGSQLFSCS